MEELLEMLTWCQLGIHDKPVSIIEIFDTRYIVNGKVA